MAVVRHAGPEGGEANVCVIGGEVGRGELAKGFVFVSILEPFDHDPGMFAFHVRAVDVHDQALTMHVLPVVRDLRTSGGNAAPDHDITLFVPVLVVFGSVFVSVVLHVVHVRRKKNIAVYVDFAFTKDRHKPFRGHEGRTCKK